MSGVENPILPESGTYTSRAAVKNKNQLEIKMMPKSQIMKFDSTLILGIAILILCIPQITLAQGLTGGGEGSGRIEGDFKFMPIPYLNYNRSIGLSLGALPMAMFNPVKDDTLSPSSIAALLGMYSTNDTWFLMGFSALFLDEDNWRIIVAGGLGSVNFQFYLDNPIDMWIPYNTQATFFFGQVQRRVYDKIYIGMSYIYTDLKTSTETFSDTSGTILRGLGLSLSMDRRKNFYYPRGGFHITIKYFTYPETFGNEFVSNKIEIEYNHYFPFRLEQNVLAARFYAGLGIGDLEFNQQFIVGQRDIRGYTQGEYRGEYLLAMQAEYRWNFYKRWGAVGFLGFASVFESINKEHNGDILPGIGIGIRFTAFTDNHMNVGLDAAVGKNDWGIYFRIGEAF
jgi:hypothetical protein